MSEHTPGPWHWWDESDNNPRPLRYDLADLIGGNGRRIANLYGGAGFLALGKTPEDIANARLIAAAPDLLLACELLKGWIEHADIKVGPVVWAELCRAITKAKGE